MAVSMGFRAHGALSSFANLAVLYPAGTSDTSGSFGLMPMVPIAFRACDGLSDEHDLCAPRSAGSIVLRENPASPAAGPAPFDSFEFASSDSELLPRLCCPQLSVAEIQQARNSSVA
jgi:hypothetical protein